MRCELPRLPAARLSNLPVSLHLSPLLTGNVPSRLKVHSLYLFAWLPEDFTSLITCHIIHLAPSVG